LQQSAGDRILNELTETHDLETLGSALNRVSGVLLAVGELYSPHDESFSGGNAFAAHAVTTAHGLLVEASQALSSLYAKILERAEIDARLAADRAALEEELAHLRQHAVTVALSQAQASHAQRTDNSAALDDRSLGWRTLAETGETSDGAAESASRDEGFAGTYQELLEKVTAVEVIANDHVMRAAPEVQKRLLPLVEGLREELNKLTRVA
jgi:hypothetical protein